MEDFIGIIIAIGIGLAAKWVESLSGDKKKKKEREERKERQRREPGRSAVADSEPWTPPGFENIFRTVTVPTQEAASEPKPEPRLQSAVPPAYQSIESQPGSLSEVTPDDLAVYEVSGDVTEPQFATEQPDPADIARRKAERREQLRRHYDRWRRAIVDTQIIAPKFND